MAQLVIYLLTLASVGTVTILEAYHDLKNQLDRTDSKQDESGCNNR